MRESNLNTREANYRQVMQQLNSDERWHFGLLLMAMFCEFYQHYTMNKQNRLGAQ
jgi:hypothetical protein